MNQIALPAVVGYYEAVEILLQNARKIGEFRTHFGLLHVPEDSHCFIRNVALPHRACNARQRRQMQSAMDRLQAVLFSGRLDRPTLRIGDVGFGSGGTLDFLARQYPQHQLQGININPLQYGIARRHLQAHPNIRLHQADFLHFVPAQAFDLLYFIESAFHMGSKAELAAKIAEALAPGGEVYLVDIFQEHARYQRMAGKTDAALFSYASVAAWKAIFAEYGLSCIGYEDLSDPVANYCRVSTPLEDFLENIVPEIVPTDRALPPAALENFKLVYHGYKRLSRQLRKGMLQYGILRFKKSAV